MRPLPIIALCLLGFHALAQSDSLSGVAAIHSFQQELNEEYAGAKSPLDPGDRNSFKGHDFFPINLAYRVNARLTATEGTPFFNMKTSSLQPSVERVYGHVTFELDGKSFRLPVYQSKDLMGTKEYADYLFFPFADATNGHETYKGGRYIDLRIPRTGDSLMIDFNMAYNPYCAYSNRYSCPLVPPENVLNIPIRAGVRYDLWIDRIGRDIKPSDIADAAALDVPATYPGGLEALANYLRAYVRYPKSALKKKIQGTVYVQFIIGADGSVRDVQTIQGISPECDEEAESAVRAMPKWKPGETAGKPVACRFVLPIAFKGRNG